MNVSSPARADPIEEKLGNRQLFEEARQDRRRLYNAARLEESAAARGLDAVIASSPVNVTYTGGCWVAYPGALSFVVTTGSGDQGVVINEADRYHFKEYSWISDVRGFGIAPTAAAEAVSLLRDLLADLGVGRGRLGLEFSEMSVATVERIRAALPEASLEDCCEVFEDARLIKTPAEIELLAMAAYCTDKAIQTAFALTYPGATEKSLAALMQSLVLELGADAPRHAHVHAGTHSTIAHTLSLERPMAQGEVIHVDFGAAFAGYVTDISRNAVIERPTPRQREIYSHLVEIEYVLIEALRSGTRACEIFSLAQREFETRHLVHPWATLGHGTGLGVHEGFEFSEGDERILEPGMVVCIEPSHIEEGDARYHIEDALVITEGAPKLISDFAPIDEMFVIR